MKKISTKLIAETVVKRRKERKLSQGALSDITGINRSMIGRIENEEYVPTIDQLQALAEALNFEITDMIVNRDHLTTLMITHNMKDAIAHGNRLIMMMEGKIILDIQGEEKKKLTVKDLLDQFERASGEEFSNDSALLG